MAAILTVNYPTGFTVTTRFMSYDGKIWDGVAMTAFATAVPADVATPESTISGLYAVTLPALPGDTTTPIWYKAVSYVLGFQIRTQSFTWNGVDLASGVVYLASGQGFNPAQIADGLLARNIQGGIDGGRTVAQAFASLRNRTEIVAGVLTVYDIDDTTPLFEYDVTTFPGNPISGLDPTI